MTRLELFRQQAPEFNNISDTALEGWFSSALVFLGEQYNSIATAKQDLAIALYAAHLCWLQKYPGQGGASRGPVLNEKDGLLQRQHQLIQNSDTWLGQSHYGLGFANLTGIGGKSKAAILTRFGTNPVFFDAYDY